jgi:hypothetical protein
MSLFKEIFMKLCSLGKGLLKLLEGFINFFG